MNSEKKNWYVVYTKYKAEKWVMDRLIKKDIEAYVPLLKVKKRYTKRIALYHYPLISCYCFVNIESSEVNKVLASEHIYDFVKINNKPCPIPIEEIELLKKITGEISNLNASVTTKNIGSEVEIIGGGLTGLKGKIIDVQGKKKFLIRLNKTGYQLNIQIDPAHLKLCPALSMA